MGAPLRGATLLHIAIEYEEAEIAGWLLDQGMNVNIRAEMHSSGFGGHTALFIVWLLQFRTSGRGPRTTPAGSRRRPERQSVNPETTSVRARHVCPRVSRGNSVGLGPAVS